MASIPPFPIQPEACSKPDSLADLLSKIHADIYLTKEDSNQYRKVPGVSGTITLSGGGSITVNNGLITAFTNPT